jgi:hypothetical protein
MVFFVCDVKLSHSDDLILKVLLANFYKWGNMKKKGQDEVYAQHLMEKTLLDIFRDSDDWMADRGKKKRSNRLAGMIVAATFIVCLISGLTSLAVVSTYCAYKGHNMASMSQQQ